MKFNKFIVSLALCSVTLFGDEIISPFAEVQYDMLHGKAHSLSDSASSSTSFVSLHGGVVLEKYHARIYLGYEPIRWNDAQADITSINVDYIKPIINDTLKGYVGAGIGGMSYKADPLKDETTKAIFTMRAGINYDMNSFVYLTTGIKYIFTNNIEIKDSNTLYSKIDNLIGGEIGLGVKF